ncbi:D-alanyl-D-alanine carboxypeptidase [Streptomyces tritici]|uniref:D-alanyl-D-alanine carboxypeptidase n=1 Tax=Streptomyces tritici TaxID=2054410 RepID=UPI003AF04CD4
MTHGGGTVAGESPDRSEQRKSSGETASGGADPRLALLGDSASPVRADQATAVFKTVSPRSPEPEADAAPGEGEDRLKAAVAAWVATEEPEAATEPEARTEPEDAAEAPSEGESDGESEAPSDGESAAEDAAEARAEAEASEPAAEPEASERAEESAAGAPAEADETAEDAPEASEKPASAEEPAAREPEAVRDAEPVAASAPEGRTATAEKPAADVPSEATPADDDAADEPAADVSATGARTGAAAESWFTAKKPSVPARTPEAADPAASEAPKAPQAPEQAPKAPEAPAKPKADEKPAAGPVDQPTAVFKAVRPPVVDQPTTALKLPANPPAPERPSTFVPLRKDGAPASQPPAAPAAPGAAPAPASAPAPAPASLTEAERTKQQPMPPLPPLDLLAELTNTPPPPPTPMRVFARRLKIWTPLVVLLLIVFAVVQFVRPLPQPALSLSVAPTYTFEGGELKMPWPGEGQGAVEVEGVGSMGTYGDQKPAPLASVAKTMTAYVILRDHPLKGEQEGPKITVDQKAEDEAANRHESRAPVKKGQEYTEKELLQLLMIPSANNVARLLARWDAGSEAAFVDKMNAAAKDLGMTSSTYTDPSGLEDSTVSTPKDQLKLAKAVMQYDVFREIVNSPNAVVEGVGRIENNNNILLEPGVGGIKTGSSTPAGGNLLWSANTKVDGKIHRVLGIVMGAKDAKILDDKLQLSIDYSLKLIQQAQKDVTSASVIRKGQVVGYVDDGLGGRTAVVATKELKPIGWPGHKVHLELTDGGKTVPHSGKAGDIVGEVSVGVGEGRVSAPVALETDLVEPGLTEKLTRVG